MLREEEQLSAFVIASLQSRNHIVQESTVLKYSVLNVVVTVCIDSLAVVLRWLVPLQKKLLQ